MWLIAGPGRGKVWRRRSGAGGGPAAASRYVCPHRLLSQSNNLLCPAAHRPPALADSPRHEKTIMWVRVIFLRLALQGGGEEEEENQPLDLSWPDTCRERITYVAFLPIIVPLWLTLPDTRKESGRVAALAVARMLYILQCCLCLTGQLQPAIRTMKAHILFATLLIFVQAFGTWHSTTQS